MPKGPWKDATRPSDKPWYKRIGQGQIVARPAETQKQLRGEAKVKGGER